jgi:methenyltetrahydromethanopterin cyclohydrolase
VNPSWNLNARAWQLCARLPELADELRIGRREIGGATCWDCGIELEGGLHAGLVMARTCLAGLADVQLAVTPNMPGTGLSVQITTDQPVAACVASQYAGWRIQENGYFAMGSGPMRALAATEAMFDTIGGDSAEVAVGVLETRDWPPADAVRSMANHCHVATDRFCLLLAPTASQAGTVQVVARSVETALHKLMELKFDLSRIVSAAGIAPLPPVAPNDTAGIGLTNDAILYGAQVTLWVRGDDDSLGQLVERIPSSDSRDYGHPFSQIFARYENDFYRIDPLLFSPAEIRLVNLDSGLTFQAGAVNLDLLATSFGSSGSR